MLVCQCNAISDREVRQVIRELLREDPWVIVVPAMVYRAVRQRAKCAGCVPNIIDLITEEADAAQRERVALPAPSPPVKTRAAITRRARHGGRHERRSPGHRAA